MPDEERVNTLRDDTEALQNKYEARSYELDVKIATWALVANGASLLVCFNSVLDHKLCDLVAIRPYTNWFFLGGASALANLIFVSDVSGGATKHLIALNFRTSVLERYRELLKEAGNEKSSSETIAVIQRKLAESELALLDLDKPSLRMIIGARGANLLMALSIGAFGWAVYQAINSGALTSALCAR